MNLRLTYAEWMNLYPEFAKLPGSLKIELSRQERTEAETAISHRMAMRRASQIADTLRSEGFEAAIAHPHYAKLRDYLMEYLMEYLGEEDLEDALAPKVESSSDDDAAMASEDDAATASEDDAAAASETDDDSDSDTNSDNYAASEIDHTSEVVTRSKVGTAAKAAAARAAAKAAAQEQENHKNLKRKFANNKLSKEQAAVHTHKKRRINMLVSEVTPAAALQNMRKEYMKHIVEKYEKRLRRAEKKFLRLKTTREEAGRIALVHNLAFIRDGADDSEFATGSDAVHDFICDLNPNWADDLHTTALDLLDQIVDAKKALRTLEKLRGMHEESYIL